MNKSFVYPKALALMVIMGSLISFSCRAQDRNGVSFSGGYSLPIGKFASKQFSNPEAGLAGEGFFGQLSYERRIGSWAGLRLTGSLNINQANSEPLIEQYSQFLPNPDTYTWQSEVTDWQLGAVLAGPVGYLSLGSVELEGHIQGGMVFAEAPGVTLNGVSSTGQNAVDARVPVASTRAFGYGAGAGVRFRLTDHLRFQLTGDWIGANAQLKDVPTYVKVGDLPPIEGSISPRRFVTVLNVGAGLAVIF
ncbi:hypothetical protein [Salmonirosea aquatica]|uniref:Outer membrane beta-barrel protein n=1 Tax=Salmonirosea aquatica TaxID=2654236 RepID=A0A7C9FDU9_9BACT|nr:hypothetical protein [Cytophagaceae bacterium SJW1-29]